MCVATLGTSLSSVQAQSIEDVLPSSIGAFNVEEFYSDERQPLYGNAFFSGLPTLRQGAAYLSEAGGEVLIQLIQVNEAYTRVLGLPDTESALGLVNFSSGELTSLDGWFEANVEHNPDELMLGRSILARPLAGYAALVLETFSPDVVSMDELRSIAKSLDIDALESYARQSTDIHSDVWGFLQAFPRELDALPLTGFHIESDGSRQPMISVNALYGHGEEPTLALVATAAGPGITDIIETHPFDPSADLTETTFGEWRAVDGVIQEVGGFVVMDDLAWVALFHMSESSQHEHRRALMDGVDIAGMFRVAAEYHNSGEVIARAAEPESTEMRLVSWAHVVESDLISEIIEITDERIVFRAGHPQLDDFSMMDILLSHHEANPFLRRIVAIDVSGGSVVIETRPASLEEAVAPR
jgi:hypothetical protein